MARMKTSQLCVTYDICLYTLYGCVLHIGHKYCVPTEPDFKPDKLPQPDVFAYMN